MDAAHAAASIASAALSPSKQLGRKPGSKTKKRVRLDVDEAFKSMDSADLNDTGSIMLGGGMVLPRIDNTGVDYWVYDTEEDRLDAVNILKMKREDSVAVTADMSTCPAELFSMS